MINGAHFLLYSRDPASAADLLYAFYNGLFGVELPPGSLGAAFFIPTAIVPLLFLTHAMMFRLLLQSRGGPVRPS